MQNKSTFSRVPHVAPLCRPLQVTCGTDRASRPATLRAPAGSSSPVTSPRCLWGLWTRSVRKHTALKSSELFVILTANKCFLMNSSSFKVKNNLTCCSLQVWIIADGVPGFPTETPGVVCHRLGVGPMKPKGQSWDYGIGVRSPLPAHVDWSQGSRLGF